jgi:hypothetical protein
MQELTAFRNVLARSFAAAPRSTGLARCLHRLAASDPGAQVPAPDVLATARSAGCLHAAVLQLEEQLLHGGSSAEAAPPTKKQRAAKPAGVNGSVQLQGEASPHSGAQQTDKQLSVSCLCRCLYVKHTYTVPLAWTQQGRRSPAGTAALCQQARYRAGLCLNSRVLSLQATETRIRSSCWLRMAFVCQPSAT